MGRKASGDLHKVTVIQVGHTLIRVCVNCVGSWQLTQTGPIDHPRLAWKPIAEIDANDRDIRFDVDITECEHVEDTTPTQPAQPAVPPVRGLAAVESAASRRGGVRAVCYCKECNGKSQHWQDDPKCYCGSCKGRKQHAA